MRRSPAQLDLLVHDVDPRAHEWVSGAFADLWTATVRGSAWVEPGGGDLDGDVGADLVLHVCSQYDVWVRFGVISGRSGATLWTRDGGMLLPIGPVGGTPGDDLALIRSESNEGRQRLVIERLDGATGDVLLATSSPLDAWWRRISLFGDADADGVADILSESLDSYGDVSWTTTIDSGRNGVTLHTGEVAFGRSTSAGDVDADGSTDLLTIIRDPDTQADSTTLLVRSLPDGAFLWTATLDADDLEAIPVPDMTGNGGDDLVLSVYTSGLWRSRVEARDGFAGTQLWDHGDGDDGTVVHR